MADPQIPPPEAVHLEVVEYDESERVRAPAWYDDTINVGDVANSEPQQ